MINLKILRYKQLFELVPLSRSSLWRRIKNKTFPKPIPLGGISVGWVYQDIVDWINQQKKQNIPDKALGGEPCNDK